MLTDFVMAFTALQSESTGEGLLTSDSGCNALQVTRGNSPRSAYAPFSHTYARSKISYEPDTAVSVPVPTFACGILMQLSVTVKNR